MLGLPNGAYWSLKLSGHSPEVLTMIQLVPRYDCMACRRNLAVLEVACSPYGISIMYLSFCQIASY
jgi:hypothetical protein